MKSHKLSLANLKFIGLTCFAGLILAGFTQFIKPASTTGLAQNPAILDVPMVKQMWSTSCGEAVITMTYNYAHPEAPLTEAEVIEFASLNGYYTEDKSPFTSPANMAKIARNYTSDVSTGTVFTSSQGLTLLTRHLRAGEPVIIDVLSNFSDPQSEAHFIVVTGISVDAQRNNAVVIHYNDPLTGTKASADWEGEQGVWNAWHTNLDPGGPGWWMVISTD
jgi:hypothetical protein